MSLMSYLEIGEKAARAAGAVLREKLGKAWVREKKRADLLTEADLLAQETIKTILLDAFPTHRFVGEETGEEYVAKNNEFCWIVDPLDGTTNFAHGFPMFGPSIALARGEEILCGVIYNPMFEECFTAEAGKGAFLNGESIRTSKITTLGEALVSISFPTTTTENSPDLLAFLRIIPITQAIRRTGSTAINLAYVAAGRFDSMICYGAHAWDVAAGILMVREAGGVVTAPNGTPFSLNSPRTLASSNEMLHQATLKQIHEPEF